jgi:hypothetical protein
VRVVPYREGPEVIENICRQAFPGLCVTSMFVLKYNYKAENYLAAEEEKENEQSLYDSIPLSKRERIEPILGKRKLPKDGWDVYDYQREFARQGVKKGNKLFRLVS